MEEKSDICSRRSFIPKRGRISSAAVLSSISPRQPENHRRTPLRQGPRPVRSENQNQAEELLKREFPGETVLVVIKEGGAAPRPEPKLKTTTGGIAKVIAVASGKGGVGKSTVTANLAVALRNMGFRVGILDADIYGPSQPKMFGVEGYLPDAVQEEGADHIVPAEPMDIRLMSIGFFIKPTDALLWRGAMAVSALKQMIHQTKWGTLDFLLADLPPVRATYTSRSSGS